MLDIPAAIGPALVSVGFERKNENRFVRGDEEDEVDFYVGQGQATWMSVIVDSVLVAECRVTGVRAALGVLWVYGLIDWLHIREQM